MAIAETISEKKVLQQLSSFIRKPPSWQGLAKLSQLATKCDVSYCATLLNAGSPYLLQTLNQWNRLNLDARNAALRFLEELSSKVVAMEHQGGLSGKMTQLESRFEKKLGKVLSKSKGGLSKGEKFQCLYTEKVMVVQQEKTESASTPRLRPELKFGQTPELSRIETLKQLNFKAALSTLVNQEKMDFPENQFDEEQTDKIQNYVSNCRDCATCLSWVRQDEDLFFPIPKQPIAFFESLSHLQEFKEPLLEQLVAFLNGKGGVVLLGCREKEGKVFPLPQSISENLKENIENRLQSWIQTIYPPVTLKRQLDLSWIPIGDPKQFQKGSFLLRLAIEPTDPSTTYFYFTSNTPKFAEQTPNGPLQISKEPIYRLMQQRYFSAQANRNVNGLREKGNWAPSLSIHFGSCQLPDKGQPEYEGPLMGPGMGVVEKREGNPLLEGRENFKSVTLLVVTEGGKKAVEEMARKGEKIDVLIEKAFPEKKFWLGSTTWLLWHSVKYEKVMTGIKKELKSLTKANDGKPPLLISTCPCLKILDKPLDGSKVEELISVGRKEAGQEVRHSFINDYDYFHCENAITAVYLYFYLNNKYRTKSVFEKPNANNPQKHKHTRKDKNPPQEAKDKREEHSLSLQRKNQEESLPKDKRKGQESGSWQQKEGEVQKIVGAVEVGQRRFLFCYMDQYGRKFYYYNDWQVDVYDGYNKLMESRYYDIAEYNQAYHFASLQGNSYYQ